MRFSGHFFFLTALVSCSAPAPEDHVTWAPVPRGFAGASSVGAGGDGAGGDGAGGNDAGAGGDGAGASGGDASSGGAATAGNGGAGAASAGGAASGGSPGTGGSAPATGPCLSVNFTTTTAHGTFAPRNVGAIWITHANGGAFVRTLDVWANRRAKYLAQWLASSKGSRVDAVSSATMNSQGPRSATWDCTDVSKAAVPMGDYEVHAEMTESDGSGPNTVIPFTLDGNGFDRTYPDAAHFTSIHLVHVP